MASISTPWLQLSLFLMKLVSVLHPCSPMATNAWVLYPLLLLATVMLGVHDVRLQIFTLAVHVLVVSIGMHFGVLCVWRGESTGHPSQWNIV